MNSKIIFFRPRSNAGPLAAANGEIESTENVRFLTSSDYNDFYNQDNSDYPDNSEGPAATDDSGNSEDSDESENQAAPLLSSEIMPVVEFALKPSVLAGWHNHPDNYPIATVDAPSTKTALGWGEKAHAMLRNFRKEAERQHLLVEPVLVMCALRLKDGNHIFPSSPVLLIPDEDALTVEGDDNFDVETMTMTIPTQLYRLRWRIHEGRKSLTDVSGVMALDLFMSEELPLYDDSEPLLPVHRASGATRPQSWIPGPKSDEEFTASLLSVNTFRMISTVRIADIANYDSFRDVVFNVPLLPKIKSISEYTPDYLHLQDIQAAGECVVSGRRSLWNLTLTLPAPAPLAAMTECTGESQTIATDEEDSEENIFDSSQTAKQESGKVIIGVESVKKGNLLHCSHFSTDWPKRCISELDFPKWLFVPDPDAMSLSLTTSDATYYVPLKRHPLLNGAFFWRGTRSYRSIADCGIIRYTTAVTPEEHLQRASYRLPDAIWRSEKEESQLFPDRLFMRPEAGEIIALCRAFRASGLVATTSPTLYLFSTQGIFLLKEMDDGTLRDAGLMTGYVAASAKSIVREGGEILFTELSGKQMKIRGTTVKEVTAASSGSANSSEGSSVSIAAIDSSAPIKIVTRPLKMGTLLPSINSVINQSGSSHSKSGSKEEKSSTLGSRIMNCIFPSSQILKDQLWSLRVVGAYQGELKCTLSGSYDLVNWHKLASSTGSALHGLYTPGLRYARLEISGLLGGSAEGIEFLTP